MSEFTKHIPSKGKRMKSKHRGKEAADQQQNMVKSGTYNIQQEQLGKPCWEQHAGFPDCGIPRQHAFSTDELPAVHYDCSYFILGETKVACGENGWSFIFSYNKNNVFITFTCL